MPETPQSPQSLKMCSSSPPSKSNYPSVQSRCSHPDDFKVDYEHEGPEGHKILRLKPSVSQWNDFPSILSYARHLGAEDDGCFKVVIPDDMLESLPERSSQKAPANAYQIRQIKRNGFWRVSTVPSEGLFNCAEPCSESLEPVDVELQKLKKLFNKNKDKQIRSVRYRVDIPAWTSKQRLLAGVPERSPIHPLKGDKLDFTKAIIPGIHTPYVYESAAFFGATFQIHAEDYRLASLNHLYKGRKIWIVVPSTAVDTAEEALGRKKKCSQFMRHRAEFFFPDKLNKLGVPYRIVDQRPGETIVILPDAYHEGFSTGYTIAEAKNYAESDWTTSTYQACDEKCQLLTAIPAAYMRILGDGEERLDLCARYGDDEVTHMPKRPLDDNSQVSDADRDVKKIKI
jgi:jumonji domain-containing protein 2